MDPDQTAPTSGSTLFDKVGPNIHASNAILIDFNVM